MNKVLVPIDGSDNSMAALRHVLRSVARETLQVVIVNVQPALTRRIGRFVPAADRDAWRGDTWEQERYDVKNGCFPPDADRALTGRFSTVMQALIKYSMAYRAYVDWTRVRKDMVNPGMTDRLAYELLPSVDDMKAVYAEARKIADAYPASDGAKVLREMLELGGEAEVLKPSFKAALKRSAAAICRNWRPANGSAASA